MDGLSLPTVLASDGSELARLPFAPGKSPYRLKGTAYTSRIAWVEANIPGGLGAMRQGVEQRYGPEVAAFFDQPFLSASWYDVVPLAQSAVVCGEILDQGYREFLTVVSEAAADGQVGRIYRWFLQMVSPKTIAMRIPKMVDTFFEFGSVEIVEDDRDHILAVFDGIPEPFAPWYATVCSAYFNRVLHINGTPHPHLTWKAERTTSEHGVHVLRMPVEVRWRGETR